ncbi:MAG: hypothetical protein IKX85_05135 [Clostridia bacterium]|nr:hypothetical protein [Clostridia bacterium]
MKKTIRDFGGKRILALALVFCAVLVSGFGCRPAEAPEPEPATQSESAPETRDETTETLPEDIREVALPLNDAERESANRFLTAFSRQGVTSLDPEKEREYSLISFVHLYLKLEDRDRIVYRSEDDESYETFTLEEANAVLEKLFGVTVSPAEGTDYTAENGANYAVHESFHDGIFWFPAADGDMHTAFAVSDEAKKTEDGNLEIEFAVYDVSEPDLFYEKYDSLYAALEISGAGKLSEEGELYRVMQGSAILRPMKDGGWRLVRYAAEWLD